jgi:hypothetical protein
VTSKFTQTLHLPPDVEDKEVDQIGHSVLLEQARARGLVITGPTERIRDELMVNVQQPGADGVPRLTPVPINSPLAEGKTEADARLVTWQADSEPRNGDYGPLIHGLVNDGKLSRAPLPGHVFESGGLIRFEHSLGSSDVTISTYDSAGGTTYHEAIEISANEHQVVVSAGTAQIQAVVDEPTEETEDNDR